MKQQHLLAKAISLAATSHEDQTDRSGLPYIMHCLHVMNTVESKDPEVLQVAVLHDTLEDTSVTQKILSDHGYSTEVRVALKCLTHSTSESYAQYINRVCKNRIAMLVKLADLRHNSDITRLKGITSKDFERISKYHKAYTQIKDCFYASGYRLENFSS
jgi:(p)ppGpp synthase/HD superfamily hydrolase